MPELARNMGCEMESVREDRSVLRGFCPFHKMRDGDKAARLEPGVHSDRGGHRSAAHYVPGRRQGRGGAGRPRHRLHHRRRRQWTHPLHNGGKREVRHERRHRPDAPLATVVYYTFATSSGHELGRETNRPRWKLWPRNH